MAKLAKFLQGVAGAAGGAGLNVEEVFSTYLYTGNGSTQTITNGIDLSGEGGLVWIKDRSLTRNHHLVDTERGIGDGIRALRSNLTDAEYYSAGYDAYEVTSANSDGFSVGLNLTNETNRSGDDYASWTFRKAPKFFDVVTYTGDGVSGRTVSHNLGSVPGFIVVKRTNNTGSWAGYHRSIGNTAAIQLNYANAIDTYVGYWNNTSPTSTEFTLGSFAEVNGNGDTFVAYLFAHNDGDGEFGPTGDQDIIKCGSYTGNGSTIGPEIDLGFEPQWLMVKVTDRGGNWFIFDTMRGFTATAENQPRLIPNNTTVEEANASAIKINSTGFQPAQTGDEVNGNGNEYIYIAIRRGPMAVPESATDVFEAAYGNASGEPAFTSNFPVDFGIWHGTISSTNENRTSTRLTQGKTLDTDSTDGEQSSSAWAFDYQDGFMSGGGGSSNFATMWRRAPSFFDVVAYDGDATAGGQSRTISHNLGAAPEMIWIKCRSFGENWAVYHSGIGATKYLNLNNSNAAATSGNWWRNTAPTDSVFTIGHQDDVNANGKTHIAYLFASLDGVSKVGSYTGTGAAGNQIDCGFSNGARFVLIKGTDTTFAWVVLDTERGIVTGNDKALFLNSDTSEITFDYADPYSAGFELSTSNIAVNGSGYNYIFYAIA